jgi:hypothetical protein
MEVTFTRISETGRSSPVLSSPSVTVSEVTLNSFFFILSPSGCRNPRLRTGYVRVLVFCNSCRHQADADLRAIVDAGRGDEPLTELRFRCSQCGTDRTDFVVTSRDNPQPW